MKCDCTSKNDVTIHFNQNIDLISALRKDNLALQIQIADLQSKLQRQYLINEEQMQENEKIKELHSEIDDLKLRLNISMNNFKELQSQTSKDKFHEDQLHTIELNSLTNQIKEIQKENQNLKQDNAQLKQEIESLIQKENSSYIRYNSQNKMLLASASSFFKTDYLSIEHLQNYLLNSTMPPLVNCEQEEKIDTQHKLIKILKKMIKKLESENEAIINEHQIKVNQLNEEITQQTMIINNLNHQMQSQKDKFYKQLSKIQREISKSPKLYKFTCPTISILPEISKTINESKLVETLNLTIDQLQNEKLKIENELKNASNELHQLRSENCAMKGEIANNQSKLKTIKQEYELKLKLANTMINDLKITKDLPDPVAEKLIIAAKSKLRQQKELIIYKDTEIEKLQKEVDELNIKISEQTVEIIQLKAQIAKPKETNFDSPDNESDFLRESEPRNQQPETFIFNYSGLSSKVKSIISPIVDNSSIDNHSKLQICVQRLNNFCMIKKKKRNKLKKIIQNCNISIVEIFQLLINRQIDLETLSENPEISSQAIAKLKERNKLVESFEKNITYQNQEIVALNEKLSKTKNKLARCIVDHKTIGLCQNDLDDIRKDLMNLVTEKDKLDNECEFLRYHNNELIAECELQKKKIDQMKYYKDLFRGMKKKCDYQRKTIKLLSKYDC